MQDPETPALETLRRLQALCSETRPPLRLHQQLRRLRQPALVPTSAIINGCINNIRRSFRSPHDRRERANPQYPLLPMEAPPADLAPLLHPLLLRHPARRRRRLCDSSSHHDIAVSMGFARIPHVLDLLRDHHKREHEVAGLASRDDRRIRIPPTPAHPTNPPPTVRSELDTLASRARADPRAHRRRGAAERYVAPG